MKQFLSILFTLALCLPALGQTKSIVTPSATTGTDNGLIRYDGTSGQLVQGATGATLSDNFALTLAGSTVTASEPLLNLSQIWNNGAVTFTGLKYNATNTASGSSSLLMDLQVGGTSSFAVQANIAAWRIGNAGNIYDVLVGGSKSFTARNTVFGFPVASKLAWGSDIGNLNYDVSLERDAAATLQMGADAATATAQKLKAHDGSGTDKDGASMTTSGGQSTGTGRGGALVRQTSLTGSTGASVNSYSTRSYTEAKPVTLTESAATTIATIAVGSSKYVGAKLFVTVNAADATDFQAISSTLNVNAVNKAGTVTSTITQVDGTAAASAGTLTATYTVTTSGANVIVQCNAVSSLTQTTLAAKWSIETLNSDDTAAITVP